MSKSLFYQTTCERLLLFTAKSDTGKQQARDTTFESRIESQVSADDDIPSDFVFSGISLSSVRETCSK